MKRLGSLLSIVVIAAFATSAMAATVTLQGSATGSYTLSSMQIDSQGNITLSVGGGTPPPANCNPSSATVSPLSVNLLTAQGSSPSAQNVTIQDNCQNNLAYTASVTSGSSWITVPSSGTGLMTITFNTSTLQKGPYSGNIQVVPSTGSTQNISVSLTVSDAASTTGCTDISASTSSQPMIFSIAPLGTNFYCMTVKNKSTDTGGVTIQMLTADWATNQDLIVSPDHQPSCSDMTAPFASGPTYWYGPVPNSNEPVTVRGVWPVGKTFYATVCNRSNSSGSFKIYSYGY